MITIPLRNRSGAVAAYAVIDDEDEHLAAFGWYRNSAGYAVRNVYLGGGRKRPKIVTVRMHREILDAPADTQVDHIDGNRLNNRRPNLRLVSLAEQMQNKAPHQDGSSRYRGVSWHAGAGKWRARVAGRHLGFFTDEHDAGDAASAFRLAHMTHTNEARRARA